MKWVTEKKRALYTLTVALSDASRGLYRAARETVPIACSDAQAARGCGVRMQAVLALLRGRRVARRDYELAEKVLAGFLATHDIETGERKNLTTTSPGAIVSL